MKLALLVVGFLIGGLVIGGLGGGAASFHYYQRLQSYPWLEPLAAPSPPATPPPPAPPAPTPVPTPTPVPQSCVLWSGDGQWNVTIYGDRVEQAFPGYCQAAQHSKFAMHVAGPASGTVTCDMTLPGQGQRFVFADTVSRTVLPCDRAAPFFDATRAPQ